MKIIESMSSWAVAEESKIEELIDILDLIYDKYEENEEYPDEWIEINEEGVCLDLLDLKDVLETASDIPDEDIKVLKKYLEPTIDLDFWKEQLLDVKIELES